MVCGIPGSARAIFDRGTGLNPGLELMPSAGANHDGRLSTRIGSKLGGAARVSCRCVIAG